MGRRGGCFSTPWSAIPGPAKQKRGRSLPDCCIRKDYVESAQRMHGAFAWRCPEAGWMGILWDLFFSSQGLFWNSLQRCNLKSSVSPSPVLLGPDSCSSGTSRAGTSRTRVESEAPRNMMPGIGGAGQDDPDGDGRRGVVVKGNRAPTTAARTLMQTACACVTRKAGGAACCRETQAAGARAPEEASVASQPAYFSLPRAHHLVGEGKPMPHAFQHLSLIHI